MLKQHGQKSFCILGQFFSELASSQADFLSVGA